MWGAYCAVQRKHQLIVAKLQCIAENAPLIGCGLVDIECQCASKNSTKILQPCLEKMCTYDETFGTFTVVPARGVANVPAAILRAQASLCNRPHNSMGWAIRITAYVTGLVPVVAIVMRFSSRYLGGNNLWWDDWLHLASVVSTQPIHNVVTALLTNIQGLDHPIDSSLTSER
jgi:hypothetical protein